MYSLGIILYELYRPFSTAMERSRGIESLRKRGEVEANEIPEYENIHASIGAIISNLIDTSPSRRPTASELLNSVFTEANLERTKSAEEIKSLKSKMNLQEATIRSQKELIIQQENEITVLKGLLNSS